MQREGFRTLLCPVDFSELSGHALRYAARLASCRGGKVVAAYANWFEAPPYFTEGRIEELKREFRDSLAEAARTLALLVKSSLGGEASGVETRVVEGLPADAIRKLVDEVHADAVVMGTHGRSGYNRWILGSVAERVLRESPVPVLTVRGAAGQPVRHILCPVSDTQASHQALQVAAGIAECFHATLTALHVREPHAVNAVPNLCSWIPAEERARCEIRELVRHGDAAEQIVAVAGEEPYDLIVLGAARRRFFNGLVLGTTTLRAVRHAPCPVLTVG